MTQPTTDGAGQMSLRAGVTAQWSGVSVAPIAAPVLSGDFAAALKAAGLQHQASWSVAPVTDPEIRREAGPAAGRPMDVGAAPATMSIAVGRTPDPAVGHIVLIDHGGAYTWQPEVTPAPVWGLHPVGLPVPRGAAESADGERLDVDSFAAPVGGGPGRPTAELAPAMFVLDEAQLLSMPPSAIVATDAASPVAAGDADTAAAHADALLPPVLHGLVHKIVSVFAYPLIAGAAGAIIKDREMHSHPYALRIIGDTIADDVAADQLSQQQWATLSGGPALLFVHGIFDTCRGAFGGVLDGDPAQGLPSMLPALRATYGNRILGFDHPTVSVGPAANAQQFLARLPNDLPFTFDVVVHSRGGLVTRSIAAAAADHSITFRRVVFVGTPNNGTAIAAPALIGHLVNRMTSFLHFVPPVGPPGAVAAMLASVLEVVKIFGQGIEGGMPGLTDMQPGSALLTELNDPTAPAFGEFFEIDAAFHPDGALGWLTRLGSAVEADAVFAEAANDVAVPSAGVGESAAAKGFPVAAQNSLRYPAGDVWHCTYFTQAATHQCLASWLALGS